MWPNQSHTKRSGCIVNSKREQLCPLWLSGLIGCAIIAALVTAYPREDSQARTLSAQHASMVSVAYLEAWLRVEPDSPLYLASLGRQYLELGRWQEALDVSRHLAQVADPAGDGRQKALLLEVVALEQMAYALPADSSERTRAMRQLEGALQQATKLSWSVPAMVSLAEQARRAGADAVQVDFYRQLAQADTGHAAQWRARLGEAALATGAYETASLSYFSAYGAATTLAERRDYFIRAVQALESADQVAQACTQAEQHLNDELAHDEQTLRYLLKLARQANRRDLVVRYARALLQRPSSALWNGRFFGGVQKIRVSAPASSGSQGGALQPAGPQDDDELIYQAFVESGDLDDAEQVAQKALAQGRDPAVWGARLAQVAQWNGHAGAALQGLLARARATQDDAVWSQVLGLAAGQEDDAAYLLAWTQRQTLRTGQAPEPVQAWNALLAEYMQAGHWVSMLRVIDRLQTLDHTQASQRLLILEVTALQQHAYEFEPGSAQRAEWIGRMHAAMAQTEAFDWDTQIMAWLAQKAQETGADDVMAHYYTRLASGDGPEAARWHAKLGDLALSRQAYDQAAADYFAAQAAADSHDD